MTRRMVLALLLGMACIVGPTGWAQVEEASLEPSRLVAEMAGLLDQALYLAMAALSAPAPDDVSLYVQGIINLLEGPGSPDFDASAGAYAPPGEGVRELFVRFLVSRIGQETVRTPYTSASNVVRAVQAVEHAERYLVLATEAAKAARDKLRYRTDGSQELRQTYAYLLAARGRTDDELVLGGIDALAEVFPCMDIWVRPGLPLQGAIDAAPPGATVHLEPGAYRERIVIDKDLVLIGEPESGTERPMSGIVGLSWDAAVTIEGDGVEVELRNLFVVSGTVGVLASGKCTVRLNGVMIGQGGTAVSVVDGAIVHCVMCEFGECERAMVVRSGGTAHVSASSLRDCAAEGVSVLAGGSLTTIDSRVSGCGGNGISLQEDATLHMERCTIVDNEGFGVFAYTSECMERFLESQPLGGPAGYDFVGRITGANNTIPGPEAERGNRRGDLCPEVYRFLKEAGPVVVPPGETG